MPPISVAKAWLKTNGGTWSTNQRVFFNWVGKQFGVKTFEDWYKFNRSDFEKIGAISLLKKYYGGSLSAALIKIYPEHDWHPWRFKRTPEGFWKDINNQRTFMDWVAKQKNITKPTDWYLLSLRDIAELGAESFLHQYYGGSIFQALQSIYPDYPWKPWKFERVPKGFWDSQANVMQYLTDLADNVGISTLDDWFLLSSDQISKPLVRKYGGLLQLLARCYPQHNWSSARQKRTIIGLNSPSKSQAYLFKVVKSLFPGVDIQSNYRHGELHFVNSNREMELDIYVPSLSIAFEYHGEQHYDWHYMYGDCIEQKLRDEEKRIACKQAGITLIEVPFWWDRNKNSIISTVHNVRPDLFATPGALPAFNSQDSPPFSNAHKRKKMLLQASNLSQATSENIKAYLNKLGESISYRVATGEDKGAYPRCKSCQKAFDSRDELRMISRGIYITGRSGPVIAKYSLCLQPTCIEKALDVTGKSASSGIYFPPFVWKVGVPRSLMAEVYGTQLAVKDKHVEWVELSEIKD